MRRDWQPSPGHKVKTEIQNLEKKQLIESGESSSCLVLIPLDRIVNAGWSALGLERARGDLRWRMSFRGWIALEVLARVKGHLCVRDFDFRMKYECFSPQNKNLEPNL